VAYQSAARGRRGRQWTRGRAIKRRWLALPAGLVLCAAPAGAQTAQANAVSSAQDAFGTSFAHDAVGLYSPYSVRGFSPVDAGNVRIEGLYFDQVAGPTDRLIAQTTVHVGISAQGYPFPAPTGIADYSLRRPGARTVISPYLYGGPDVGFGVELDTQLHLSPTLGLAAGTAFARPRSGYGDEPHYSTVGILPRWTPSERLEIIPFWSRMRYTEDVSPALIFPAPGESPPRPARGIFPGPSYAGYNGTAYDMGLVMHARPTSWAVDLGMFRSIDHVERGFADLFLDAQADGRAQETLIAYPAHRSVSNSGEFRVQHELRDGPRLHILLFSMRGRDRHRVFGGEDVVDLGPATIGERTAAPPPAFQFGTPTEDHITQWSPGLSYRMAWSGLGELSLGVQRMHYRKETRAGPAPPTLLEDNQWLFSGSASLSLNRAIAAYFGYTQGLEESPPAPQIAVNRAEAPAAVLTRQAEAGLRWRVAPALGLVAGVFDLSKPYYALDAGKRFTLAGQLRNRGIEASLSGPLAPGLSFVGGFVLLDSRAESAAGTSRPIGSVKAIGLASFDYRFAHSPVSVDFSLQGSSSPFAAPGLAQMPGRATLNMGARYHFRLAEWPATFRAAVTNVLDTYAYDLGSDGSYAYIDPRRLTLSLAADL
jgi:iron complex outermembrane receptor protein